MNTSSRERTILILAGVIAALFAITTLIPVVRGIYNDRNANIEAIDLDIRREQRLIEETASWRDRRIATEVAQAELQSQIFNGETVAIAEANIQRKLTQIARETGITVISTRLAERLVTDGWLLISQEMSYRTNQQSNTITFLKQLEQSQPRLRVTEFTFNTSRSQNNGSITVVGFVKNEGLLTASNRSR